VVESTARSMTMTVAAGAFVVVAGGATKMAEAR
jgi:hypothetical protein